MNHLRSVVFILLFSVAGWQVFGQLSEGGVPFGFQKEFLTDAFQDFDAGAPDFDRILKEDAVTDAQGLPPRFGETIPVELSLANAGTWTYTNDGKSIWRLGIRAEGALAIGLYFKDFKLPQNARLFIYSPDHQQILGAYSYKNNRESGLFGTELIDGDYCIIELDVSGDEQQIEPFTIREVLYAYRYAGDDLKSSNGSDFCEVNVNCSPEGDNWQDPKRGVVRIQVKVSTSSYWCTGSLVNNTAFDKTPYILTADHCAYQLGGYATADDLEDWTFYFHYEGLFCESTNPVPGSFSMQGATKIAQGGNRGSTGSDFYLVRLISPLPGGASVYFNGWSAAGIPEENGVTVHHPDGDIKKISTYTTPLVSSSWAGNGLDSHWKVIWTETLNGWGVTEGGSSGSPLFDAEGRIIGTLTGGLAACESIGSVGPDKPDYYGKFAYHWESNGSSDTAQLKPWLDPGNTGVIFLNGMSTGIGEHQQSDKSHVKIFPNPSDVQINLEFTTFAPSDVQVTIYNLMGKLVLASDIKLSVGAVPLDVKRLTPGSYFLRVQNNQYTETHKILIR